MFVPSVNPVNTPKFSSDFNTSVVGAAFVPMYNGASLLPIPAGCKLLVVNTPSALMVIFPAVKIPVSPTASAPVMSYPLASKLPPNVGLVSASTEEIPTPSNVTLASILPALSCVVL